MTTTAMECLIDDRIAEARDRYEELLAEFPDDKVARLMRDVLGRQASARSRFDARRSSAGCADVQRVDLLPSTSTLAHRLVEKESPHGLMNLGSAVVGGVPMCHGAGGMAGHIAFGGRTGGAPILLGSFLLLLALFLSSSIGIIFRMVPPEVLGVILFLAGAQLALGSCDFSKDKGERFTTVLTAGLAMWNIGIAFVLGLAVYHAFKRRWIRV